MYSVYTCTSLLVLLWEKFNIPCAGMMLVNGLDGLKLHDIDQDGRTMHFIEMKNYHNSLHTMAWQQSGITYLHLRSIMRSTFCMEECIFHLKLRVERALKNYQEGMDSADGSDQYQERVLALTWRPTTRSGTRRHTLLFLILWSWTHSFHGICLFLNQMQNDGKEEQILCCFEWKNDWLCWWDKRRGYHSSGQLTYWQS